MSKPPNNTGWLVIGAAVFLLPILLLMFGIWRIDSPGAISGPSDYRFLGIGRNGPVTHPVGVNDRPINQN
jgi:hypothetical protein